MSTSLVLPLLLVSGGGHGAAALAQPAGTFTATGSMATPRSWHTATLLADGKVLIAGGLSGFQSPSATAELYDPDTGKFTPTGNMTTPRYLHTATLLPDGRVLIAGGSNRAGQSLIPTNSAEIYDPLTGTFAAAGDMLSAHACHQANLLGNGKVLITGGSDLNGVGSRLPELYDPLTGTFASAGIYASDTFDFNSCQGAVSALLPDGKVLIVWEEQAAEVYDPDAGSFTATGKPIAESYNDGLPTATLLMNGKVLVAGGADDSGIHTSAEIFDSSEASFTATGKMAVGHVLNTATLLPDGKVLVAGSLIFGGESLGGTELYDPVLGTFSAAPEMNTSRCCHTSTLLKDGRVLIAGGSSAGISTSLAEVYSPRVLAPAPVLLSISGDGAGQGAILHAGTGRLVTAGDPAVAGEALEIYCTGLADGSMVPPQVAVGGRLAQGLYFGTAPGFTGLNQVNVRVPSGIAAGPAVPVRLIYLDRPSNAVTIGAE